MATRGFSLNTSFDLALQQAARRLRVSSSLIYWRVLALTFLFIVAFGIRMLYANEPPLNFHATRQYRSLIIARAYYYESATSIPEWQKQVARLSQVKQGILEPPILEWLVSLGYRLLGGEQLWLPRFMSSLFWLLGGRFLYLIGKRIADADAALLATGFYLFLPFAVVASRSFQPDPLMVMLMLASVLAILRYQEARSSARLFIAAALAALTFVVKPGSVFVVVAAFLALAVSREGVRRALSSHAFLLFSAITVTPSLLIYLYGILSGTFLIGEAQKTLLPQLWLSAFFWRGWLINIDRTVGFISFIGALLGALMFRQGLPRTVMTGLWIGYILFALALNYNLATHDYYQLQLIPIVALSVAPILAGVLQHLKQVRPQLHWRAAAWGILLLGLFLSLADARSRLVNPDGARKVSNSEAIGARVNHSTKTVFLSADYGVPLEYHGLLSGKPWPLASDLEWERLAGLRVINAEARFNAEFAKDAPEYFIVEDLREYEQQPDLKKFLTSNYAALAVSEDYVIFDLRRKQ